jgi:acyl-CoA thioester hydrolase
MPLVAATWVETMERRASLRRYAFLRAADRKPVATAQTLWIFVDLASGRARDVPPQVREAFPRVLPDDPELRAAVPIAIPGRPPAA